MPAEVATIPPPSPLLSTDAPPLPDVARDTSVCANCGTPLAGPFCSNCGQHVKDMHRSVWRFFMDFLDNAFCWDNKLFLTLKPLLTRPGAVTLDYLAGRRVRYVHPFRLFLFTSAVCLTIIQYLGGTPIRGSFNSDAPSKKRHQAKVTFNAASPSHSPAATGPASPSSSPSAAGADEPTPSPASEPTQDATEKAGDDDDDKHDAAKKTSADDFGDRIGRAVEARIKKDGGGQRLQQELTEGVQRRVSWVALALLPIFAVMLRGLYWRRDSYYFAHFVFSLHYHTALLLFGASYVLLQDVLPTSLWLVRNLLHLCLLLPGVYLCLALRRMYGETVKRTLAKVFVLGMMHLLTLFIGLAMVGALAAWRALA